MAMSLIDRIRKTENLPSLPSVAVEVLNLSRSPDASGDALARIIQRDPAITAKILTLVNSSLYGIPCHVASVKQAISMLGVRSVTVTVISLTLIGAMQDGAGKGGGRKRAGLDLERFWRRALSTATAAKLLATAVSARLADDAFVCGLLCDLGILATWRCARDEYGPILEEAVRSGRPLEEIERERLGLTHADLGRELLQAWKLPDILCQVIGAHHADSLDALPESARQLGAIVRSAARVAALFNHDLPPSELNQVRGECIKGLGISPEALEAVFEALDTQVRDAAKAMSLRVGKNVNYAQLQAAAATALASLTVQAEVERSEAARNAEAARYEVTRLHDENRHILEVASTDGLTRVGNRASFDQRLEEELSRARASGDGLGMLMVDIDHFKKFNDADGHQAGDEVLRAVAASISAAVAKLGFVARYGGDELAVILPRATAPRAAAMGERIRRAVEATPIQFTGKRSTITASIGAACLQHFSGTPSACQLVQLADRCLYEAKKAGRNRVAMPTGPAVNAAA